MTPQQFVHRESILSKLAARDEWRQDIQKNLWVGNYMRSAEPPLNTGGNTASSSTC
jgi:hypothetical protein